VAIIYGFKKKQGASDQTLPVRGPHKTKNRNEASGIVSRVRGQGNRERRKIGLFSSTQLAREN